ncbi:hypothetical protein PSTT_00579, partial [Puccinia striiformis]
SLKWFFASKGQAYKNFQGALFLDWEVWQIASGKKLHTQIKVEHLHTDYLQGLAKIEEIYDQHFLNHDLSQSERQDRKLKVMALAGSVNTTLLKLVFQYITLGGRKKTSA